MGARTQNAHARHSDVSVVQRAWANQFDASFLPASSYFDVDLVGASPPIKRLLKGPGTLGLV